MQPTDRNNADSEPRQSTSDAEPANDIERELIRLRRSLASHHERWALYLLKHNHGQMRDRISRALTEEFKPAHRINVTEKEFPALIDFEQAIAALPSDTKRIEVTGMDTWLTPQRARQWNLRREPFVKSLHCPMLIWLTPGGVSTLATEAPDLWDWRSGIFDFCVGLSAALTNAPMQPLAPTNDWLGMDFGRRATRIDELISYLRSQEAQSRKDTRAIIELHNELAQLLIRSSRIDEAREVLERASHSKANGTTAELLGDVAFRLGRTDAARQHYEDALTIFHSEQNGLGEANTLRSLGNLSVRLGQMDAALQNLKTALSLYRGEHDGLGEANTLRSLGELAQRVGQIEVARQHYANALILYRSQRNGLGEANTLRSLGELAHCCGQVDNAQQYFEDALPLFRSERDGLGEANTLQSLGNLARSLGQDDTAQQHFEDALPLYRSEHDGIGEANILQSQGDLARHRGQVTTARQHLETARALFRDERDGLGEANTLISLGDLTQSLGYADEARNNYEQALQLYEQQREPIGLCYAHGELARLLAASDTPAAEAHLDAMRKVFASSSLPVLEAFTQKVETDVAAIRGMDTPPQELKPE